MLAVYILAACGAAVILWAAFGRLLLPLEGDGLWLVMRLTGDAADLERSLRAVRFLQRAGLFKAKLLPLDCGLTEEGRLAAKLLFKSEPIPGEAECLGKVLQLGTVEHGGKGDPVRDDSNGGVSEPG